MNSETVHPVSKSKRRLAFGLIGIALLVTAASFFAARDSDAVPDLTVTFRGQESGFPYLAAGFDVTNRDSISLTVANVQIQVWSNGFWAAHSTKYTDFVVPSKPGGYELPVFEPGETKRIFAECPNDSRWRIKLTCGREVTGASGLVAKSWFAIRRRERPNLQGRMWIPSGYLYSDEVPLQKTRD